MFEWREEKRDETQYLVVIVFLNRYIQKYWEQVAQEWQEGGPLTRWGPWSVIFGITDFRLAKPGLVPNFTTYKYFGLTEVM